ncbi:hypothetical protein AB0L41_48805 [Amycolatopsis mediterranei]|uniref:hypothetical protein n=1 Tax=Amycolatopsis mediterranei TaxID=33910 RepID=UPI0034461187
METFEQVGDEFGTVRSRHRVDNRRRRVTGFWALAIGAVATVLGTYLVIITDPSAGFVLNRNAGAMLGLGLVGLALAARQLTRAWRGGSGEYYEVREDGILHANARQVRGWRWDDVTKVTLTFRTQENGLSRALGTGFRCVLTFADGARIRIDGLAENPHALVSAVREHRPDLPVTSGTNGLQRLGAWWLAFAAVFLAAGIWMLMTVLGSNTVQDVTDANGSVTETQISTVSDTGYLFLGIGMLVCFVGLIVSVSLFVSSRSVRRRLA